MTHEEFQSAANYWNVKDKDSVRMDRPALLAAVEAYIAENNTCALATAFGSFVRCTPIEYSYHDGAFWLFSEGGEKFTALEHNPNVCLAIYDKYGGFQGLRGLQITGVAEMIEPFSEAYNAHAAHRKVSMDFLKKLSSPMNLIRIRPVRADFLCSAFKKEGFSPRQTLLWEGE